MNEDREQPGREVLDENKRVSIAIEDDGEVGG